MSNEIVKAEQQHIQTASQVNRGFEHVDMEEVTMPRVKIMQAMSPELDDPDYDFKKGDLVHNLLMEKVSDTFIPLSIWTSRVLFVPRDNQKKLELLGKLNISDDGSTQMLCRARDGKHTDMSMLGACDCKNCPLGVWDGNTPPACTASINVLALFDGLDMPAVFQFSGTSQKYGKKFRDTAVFVGGDLFSRKYKLVPKQEKNEKGTFYVALVKPAGKPTPEEFANAEEQFNRFAGVSIVFDEDAPVEYSTED